MFYMFLYLDDWDDFRPLLFRRDVLICLGYFVFLAKLLCMTFVPNYTVIYDRHRELRYRIKRLEKERRKCKKRRYKPQAFTRLATNLVKREISAMYMQNEEAIKKEIEALVLLFISAKDSKSWKGVLAAVLSYVKSHFSTSLSSVVITCIQDIFELDSLQLYKIQNGDPKENEKSTEEEKTWMDALRTAHSNWKLATQNEGFEKISKLMSLLIGAGLVSAASINCDVKGLQLFSELSVPKHVSAFDLADASMSTVLFFVEGGYESFRTGSLKPLLYGEHEMRKFDEDYLKCRKYADFARPGNLSLLSIDENDLEKLYADTIDLGKRLQKTVKSSYVKKTIQDRITKLQDLHATFVQYRQTGGIREKPFCIGLYGKSSVGKSTVGPLLMVSTLVFNGFRADDEALIVLNEHDKYMSNYKSSIQGVFLDDVGNTKADFVETAPTVRILEMVNNVKMYANMAEAELKGKVSIQPKVVVCTTNVKDFCAHTYSNEPVSIARRANVIITVSVRPEFATNNMLDEDKVYQHYGDDQPEIPDLWTFKVEKAYPVPSKTKGKADDIGWKTYVFNGKKMEGVDIFTVMRLTNHLSKKHFKAQKSIVKNNTNIHSRMTFCESCRAQVSLCTCGEEEQHVDFTESAGTQRKGAFGRGKKAKDLPTQAELDEMRFEEDLRRPKKYTKQSGVYIREKLSTLSTYIIGDYSWDDVVARSDALSSTVIRPIANWTPAWFFQNRSVRMLYGYAYGYFPRHIVYMGLILAATFSMLVGAMLPRTLLSVVYVVFLFCATYVYLQCTEYNLLIEAARNTTLADRLHRIEISAKVKYILAGSLLLAAAYSMSRNARQTRSLFSTQGMMHPTQREIDERDANDITETIKEEMNWANVHVTSVPVSHKSKTTTFADLKEMAKKNLTFMSTTIDGKFYGSDAFFVCSNIALIPHHSWKSDDMLCEFTRHDRKSVGGNFKSYVSRKHSIDIPGMDASLVWVANGGSWRDMRDFFPQTMPVGQVACEMLWKDDLGMVKSSQTLLKVGQATNGHMSFPGGYYTLKFDTRNGMCMSPLVSETKSPYIAAFHLGGIDNTPSGCGGTILRSQLDAAIAELSSLPSVLVSASAGTMETEKYGVQFMTTNEIHEKSPLRRLPILDGKCPNIEIFGSCLGRVTYYSDVVQSHISHCVEKVCGVANKWGAPKFRKGDPWLASLEHSCQPSHGLEGSLLARACEDYLKPFENLLKEYAALRHGTRPLTRMETVCGIDGKKFVDKMPPNTSVGYPLSGPKRAYLTYLDPAMFEGFNCPAELDDMFWQEFEKARAAYAAGERYYPAFKACLKDEPTKLSKDKVRVFQAAPIVLQMMTRMYFLPIARILSLFPALSECAVGVNCQGPDWHHLSEHMRQHGTDRILAGDYSKYDLRMPAQVMFSAFRILIEIARICGYSSEDLTIMTGIATDICYPVMAYNGDLIQHIGSNPSGQNLTVYINSVVNSLLFRCAFYDLRGVDSKLSFRSVCALMTYGDDVKGSVKEGFDDFNHVYCAEFFAKHDMKFTMPDKESTPVPFMRDVDADFLKRKNVWCPELEFIMGALDEDSIFKSLHSNLKSKANTKEKLAADNIDGALREWFNHGRGVYEKRRAQMREVAEMAGISHMCTLLDSSFDERVEHWKDRYIRGIETVEEVQNEEDYTTQAGEYIPAFEAQVADAMEVLQGTVDFYFDCEELTPAERMDSVLVDFSILTESPRMSYSELMDVVLYWIDESVFYVPERVATISKLVLLSLLVQVQRFYFPATFLNQPLTAVAAMCGEEFQPLAISIYDHCNGTPSEVGPSMYGIAFNVFIGMPLQFWLGRQLATGRIRIRPTTLRTYHFLFLMMVVNMFSWRWIAFQFYQLAMVTYIGFFPEMFGWLAK